MDDTLDFAREIYGESILEDYTRSYTPTRRKSTKIPRVGDSVLIGLSGRINKEPLIIKNQNNEPYRITPALLRYGLSKSGEMNVALYLQVFGGKSSQSKKNESVTHFQKLVADMFSREEQKLQMLFMESSISYLPSCYDFKPLPQIASEQLGGLYFFSETHYLPIDWDRGLWNLQRSFLMLMPIWCAINQIARTGEESHFSQHLDSLIAWHKAEPADDNDRDYEPEDEDEESETENASDAEVDYSLLDNLESYKFVRAGQWWRIVARDRWTCQSCGRSSQKDGITLEVDHIVPRSKGGTNDDDNLQTLCKKCNIGKSNLDDTNLRELSE